MNQLRVLMANKHTTFAAVFYLLAKIGAGLGGIWMPAHKAQFDETANLIEAAAVSWGLLMAGDASASVQTNPPPTEPPTKT